MTHSNACPPAGPLRFLRLPDIIARRRTSRTTIYGNIAAGTFPPPVKLGPNTSAWPEHEIEAIDRARLASASDDALQQLVAALLAARRPPAQPSLDLT